MTNKPLSGLRIIKLNSVTRQPIEGVEFQIVKMSGERVTNEFNGHTFKTDRTGQIYIPGLRYKVMVTTNKGEIRVIADNLSTTTNNVIDCSNASLGLRNDEFVTSVTFVFGTVKAGFAQVEQPQIFARTLTTLPNGYQFANKADVGGKYGNEWVVGNSTWLTTIYAKPEKLPRTGY